VLNLSARRVGAAVGRAAGTDTDAGARHLALQAQVEEDTSEDERASRLHIDFDIRLEEALDHGAAGLTWGGSGGEGGGTSQRAGASSRSSSRNSSWTTNSNLCNSNSLSRREQLQMAIKSELEKYLCVCAVRVCVCMNICI
jgi:hypothetical protein